MSRGWLVNDCLTCIPGVKTFWHDLLEWFPNLEARMTNFTDLIEFLRGVVQQEGVPNYIIRNATFFGCLNLPTKTISFLQDCCSGLLREQQIEVCNTSDVVVCNSPFIRELYQSEVKSRMELISIGTDFNLFRPLENREELREKWNISSDSILFIGSTDSIKGFEVVERLISDTTYNFCLVMKDDFAFSDKRVRVFNRVDHETLVEIVNCCTVLICPSTVETLHLAGIEAAACGLPIITTDVGIYYGWNDGPWGRKVVDGNFTSAIDYVFSNLESFDSRSYFLQRELDRETCGKKWKDLLDER